MRTGDTQSPNSVPNIYLEIQTDTPEDVSSRVIKFHLDEQLYGGVYEFWLDNADSALSAKDYKGFKVDFELGFVDGTRSQYPTLWIEKQTFESVGGKLTMKLTCMDAWGLMSAVNSSVGAQYWNYPELAPGEEFADADYYDKTIKQIVTSVVTEALDATFAIDDDDSETYFGSLKPPISITNARTGIFQLMAMTDAYLLYKNDDDFHVIKASDHTSVHTFALSSNVFWESADETAITFPNRVVYHGKTALGVELDSGNNGLDATSYARIGIYIDEHYYASRMEIDLITDQTMLNSLASATILKLQGQASQGSLYAPMHCSLELLDCITVTDTRYSGTKTITGYCHRLIRDYEANEDIYTIRVSLGGVATAYTPGNGTPPIAKGSTEPPVSMKVTIPLTFLPAYLPCIIDIVFTAVDQDDISWAAGTIKTASGTIFTVSAGTLNLDDTANFYLYYNTTTGDHVLDTTQTFGDTIGAEKILVAFAKKGTTSSDKALVVAGTRGADLFIDELSAITANLGLITAGEIRVGTGTLGSNYTGWRMWVESSIGRFAGYNNNVLQFYSGTDGKLYAGGGSVFMDSTGLYIRGAGMLNLQYSGNPTYTATLNVNVSGNLVLDAYGDIILGGSATVNTYVAGDLEVTGVAYGLSGVVVPIYGESVSEDGSLEVAINAFFWYRSGGWHYAVDDTP
jgi:hypothetical protein